MALWFWILCITSDNFSSPLYIRTYMDGKLIVTWLSCLCQSAYPSTTTTTTKITFSLWGKIQQNMNACTYYTVCPKFLGWLTRVGYNRWSGKDYWTPCMYIYVRISVQRACRAKRWFMKKKCLTDMRHLYKSPSHTAWPTNVTNQDV